MFLHTDFEYNGIPSYEMGVYLVRMETGMIESSFGYKRDIVEEKPNHKHNPYFYGFETDCLTLKIVIAKIDEEDLEWTFEERKKIVEWFYQNYYCQFISADNPEIIYYCTPVDKSIRFDNGKTQGYAELTLRCNSPFVYTPTYIEEYNHMSAVNNVIEINNLSNILDSYYPEVQISTNNTTSFKLVNLTDGGEEFEFTDVSTNETIYVNNETKHIETDKVDNFGHKMYRLQNFNKNWFKLVKGVNRIQIVGNVDVLFRCSYPMSV